VAAGYAFLGVPGRSACALGRGTLAKLGCFHLAVWRSLYIKESQVLGTILIIILILLLLGAWPAWPYSRGWGYYPTGTLGLILLIVIILALVGRL
jgi:hypothetical protein